MSLYYLLLLLIPFHNDPRLGANLFTAETVIVTPVKIVGLLAVMAALVAPRAAGAAPRLANPLTMLFLPFAVLPVLATLAVGLPVPTDAVSALIAAGLLFVATRLLVTTTERMSKVLRTVVIAFAFGSLWTYKQHYLEGSSHAWGLELDSNAEALMLVTVTPLAFWMVRHDTGRWWRRIALGCALLLAGGILLTESRGGIIAAGLMGVVAAIHGRRKIISLWLLAVTAILVIEFGPAGLSQRFEDIKFSGRPANGDQASAQIHLALLKAGLYMIAAHPVFGVGLGEFKVLAPQYNSELRSLTNHSYIAHDTFIQIGAEGGLPVLLLLVAMIGVAMVNLRTVSRNGTDKQLADLAFSIRISFIGLSIAAASMTIQLLPFWMLIFLSQNLREVAEAADPQHSPNQVGVIAPIPQLRRAVG
jgi:O-antigen ligase